VRASRCPPTGPWRVVDLLEALDRTMIVGPCHDERLMARMFRWKLALQRFDSFRWEVVAIIVEAQRVVAAPLDELFVGNCFASQ